MISGQTERRKFIRVAIDSRMEFRRGDSPQRFEGQAVDLSATGLRFTTQAPVEKGEVIQVVVHPGASVTPPLESRMTVLRIAADKASGIYEVAGMLEH